MHVKPGSLLLLAVTMMVVGGMSPRGNAGQVVLYVANSGSGTITEYSQSGSYLGVFASGLDGPGNLTVDHAGDVLVTTVDGFSEYSPSGSLLLSVQTTFALGQIQVAANGNLLVNSYYGGDVLEYSPTGQYLGVFSNPGLQRAYYSALDPQGNLYVTDHFSGVIEKISPTGVVEGALPAYLPGVAGIAFDAKGDLFAILATYSFEGLYANAIVEFAPNGNLIGTVTYLNLSDPTGLAIGPDGNLYVSDYLGNTIAEYSPYGAFLGTFTTTNLDGPHGIAFSAGSVPEPSSAVLLVIAVMAGAPFVARLRCRRLSLTPSNEAKGVGCGGGQ